MKKAALSSERTALNESTRVRLEHLYGSKSWIVSCIVQQEELLSALFGDHLRDDGMVELLCGVLRCYGARLIAITEEILARLLVADDTDLKDAFPLFKLIKGKRSQKFQCVIHR